LWISNLIIALAIMVSARAVVACSLLICSAADQCSEVSSKVDCGYSGIDQSGCESKGCCWVPVSPNPNNEPWCFNAGSSPSPTPSPSPSPSPTPSAGSNAKNPISGQDTFVHLFEWKWSDVALECEQFLGPKGFTAVQISPPNDHMSGDAWWTRYQPVTYELVSRSGNADEFADMVKRCSAVGVGIYADAVINHIAAGSGTSIAGKSYGNRATPIYSANDMHHNDGDTNANCQVSNYADKYNVQHCDLSGLPDLCTSCDYVQKNRGWLSQSHERSWHFRFSS
jgi:hypothetical protein